MNVYVPSRRVPLSKLDFTPGPFRWMDLASVLTYLLMMFGIGFLLIPLLGGLIDQGWSLGQFSFLINAVIYVVVGAVMWVASRKDFLGSAPGRNRLSPVHLLWLPVAWISATMLSAVAAMTIGGLETSINQQEIMSMTTEVPFWAMFPVIALIGPFVEEYLFRHLLIGKLSRKFQRIKGIQWYLVVISAVVFASIHFISGGDFRLQTLVPYLSLGLVISVFYVLMRKSFFMAWALHVMQNGMSLILLYSLGPIML